MLIKLTLSCVSSKMLCRSVLVDFRLKVRMSKISDKIGKFLLHYSNLCRGLPFILTVYIHLISQSQSASPPQLYVLQHPSWALTPHVGAIL